MWLLDYVFRPLTMILPIAFAGYVWFSRREFPRWAKIAALLGCLAGVAWDVITLFQPPLSIKRYPFLLTVSIKQLLGGTFLGVFISVLLAGPSRKGKLESNT